MVEPGLGDKESQVRNGRAGGYIAAGHVERTGQAQVGCVNTSPGHVQGAVHVKDSCIKAAAGQVIHRPALQAGSAHGQRPGGLVYAPVLVQAGRTDTSPGCIQRTIHVKVCCIQAAAGQVIHRSAVQVRSACGQRAGGLVYDPARPLADIHGCRRHVLIQRQGHAVIDRDGIQAVATAYCTVGVVITGKHQCTLAGRGTVDATGTLVPQGQFTAAADGGIGIQYTGAGLVEGTVRTNTQAGSSHRTTGQCIDTA